jgi:hypothetical protein
MTSKTTWVRSQAFQAVDFTSKQPIYLQTARFSNLDRTNPSSMHEQRPVPHKSHAGKKKQRVSSKKYNAYLS